MSPQPAPVESERTVTALAMSMASVAVRSSVPPLVRLALMKMLAGSMVTLLEPNTAPFRVASPGVVKVTSVPSTWPTVRFPPQRRS